MKKFPSPFILIFFYYFISYTRSSDILDTATVEAIGKLCDGKKCVKKCCPENQHVIFRRKKCMNSSDTFSGLSSFPVYDSHIRPTGEALEDLFGLDSSPPGFKILLKNKKNRKSVFEATLFGFNVYLTESTTLYLELPNAFIRWLPKNTEQYCLDFHDVVQPDNSTRTEVGAWVLFDDEDDEMTQSNGFFTTGMIISCVFLVLVLVVYSLLPELRNLCGLVLMAYTFSLLCAFIFLMVVQRGGHSTEGCIGLTLSVYFFFLASFCWMNIMSYDIWWTFRGYAKARPIHRRGERFKFCMYCLYAWGLPALMTVSLAVLNHVDLCHWPWFITPKIPDKGCFLEGGEKLVYLYAPMLIMIVLNWIFYLMTAFNIWRLSRGTAVLDSAAAGNPASHRKQRHRLLLYLKLSILMGLNWILEVVSSFKPQLQIWYITDAYNLLIGLSIFLIFVCKNKIFKKLHMRLFPTISRNQSKQSRSRSSSVTETSNISQDVPVIQINPNPKGQQRFF